MFFKKKKNNANKRNVELIFDDNQKALAFGVQWRSIVTNDVKKFVSDFAKAQGATHMLLRGQQVGVGVIDDQAYPQLSSGVVVYPAAQVAARQYGGDAIFAVKVDEGEYWVALIRSGLPTSSDTFLMDGNDFDALTEARRLLDGVSSETSNLSIYTNIPNHEFQGSVKHFSTDELFLAASNDEDHFSKIKKESMNLPLPAMIVIGLGVVLLVGQQSYKMWEAKKRTAAAMAAAAEIEDPSLAWARIVAEWESTKSAPNFDGLLAAREALGRLPVILDGWKLTKAKCSAGAIIPAAPTRPWSCIGSYERPIGASPNRDIRSSVPEGWTATFTPLKNMQVSKSFQAPVAKMLIAQLLPVNDHSIETASLLQELSPAFRKN